MKIDLSKPNIENNELIAIKKSIKLDGLHMEKIIKNLKTFFKKKV